MATAAAQSLPSTTLSREQRVGLYRTIYAARRIDDKEITGKRQNKVFFQINGVGHEAVQAAASMVFRPGHDWFFFYYRDRALAYGLGYTARASVTAVPSQHGDAYGVRGSSPWLRAASSPQRHAHDPWHGYG